MADQLKCGQEPAGSDFCSCGCTSAGHWCGTPECLTTHFRHPLTGKVRAAADNTAMLNHIRAAGDSEVDAP